jgi:hypothetical protein
MTGFVTGLRQAIEDFRAPVSPLPERLAIVEKKA